MASQNSRLENQILHFSKQKKWDKVEALWPQFIEDPSSNPKFFATLALRMVKQEKQDDLKSWTMLLVEALEGIEDHASLIRVARGVLTGLPEFDELRQPLINTLRVKFAKNPQCETYLEACGLGREEGLNEPLKRFLRFIKCSVGEVFQHAEWGEGQVTDLDLEVQRVHIAFPKVGPKSFSFEGVNEFLKKIPKSHLFAQRLLNPEGLRQRAKDTPVDFMKFCLKCLGGTASRAELKDALTVGVFDTRKWNSWWTRSRDHFRFDPYIGFSGTAANVRLELRTKPKDFHEELLKDFLQAEALPKEYSLVTDLLRVSATRPVSEEITRQLVTGLEAKYAQCDAADASRRTEYLYLLEDVREALGASCPTLEATAATDQLLAGENPIETICGFSMADNQVRAAKELKESYAANWAEYAELLFLAAPMRIGQRILREMIEDGNTEGASHIAEQLLHKPYENPDLFLWILRACNDGKLPELQIDMTPQMLVDSCFEVIDDCHHRIGQEDPEASGLRGLSGRFQNFLMENHFALLSEVFEGLETDEARRRYQGLMKSHALSEGFKVALDQVLRAMRRDLEEDAADGDTGQGEHLVTAETFKARQAEYQHIKNEEVPENSKAIGIAAAMGDLSENAEYESAKDRQKVLFRRLESLEDLLQRARVIEPEQIPTDQVGFGTTFAIKNMDSGETEEYTLLGIWDADPENNVLSYLTPFGRQFMKRKQGDVLVVVRPGGGSTQYKVIGIRNALTERAGRA